MRILKMVGALAVVGFYNVGCETVHRAGDKIESTAVAAKDKVVAEVDQHRDLSVGCLPANKDPGEGWRSTGSPLYVTPGCETAAVPETTASAEEEGAEALPPLADVEVEEDAVVVEEPTDIVEGTGGTPCGMTVVALSSGAVGDPCMTTEGVIEALNLSHQRKEEALAMVGDARNLFGTAVAH